MPRLMLSCQEPILQCFASNSCSVILCILIPLFTQFTEMLHCFQSRYFTFVSFNFTDLALHALFSSTDQLKHVKPLTKGGRYLFKPIITLLDRNVVLFSCFLLDVQSQRAEDCGAFRKPFYRLLAI